jgi:hypothetical protein
LSREGLARHEAKANEQVPSWPLRKQRFTSEAKERAKVKALTKVSVEVRGQTHEVRMERS